MNNLPKVSIIIPCRNEEKYIGKCLDSLVKLDYPKNLLEVFVCDGLSSDNTKEIVSNYKILFPFIKLLINEKQTAPYAMNRGISESRGDIIVILGAHTELFPNYIKACLDAFNKDPNIGCVGGFVENVPENSTSEIISFAMSSPFGVGNVHFRTGKSEGYVDTVGPGAYKREVFEKSGVFDVELTRNQDDEFNFRIQKDGFRIYLFGVKIARYFVRASYRKLFRQYYQYGYWKVYVNKKHKTITTIRQIIPFLFILFLINIIPSYFYCNFVFLSSLLLLFFYFVSGFVFAYKIRGSLLNVFRIFFCFGILHISYGLGYLHGLIIFFILNQKPSERSKKITR